MTNENRSCRQPRSTFLSRVPFPRLARSLLRGLFVALLALVPAPQCLADTGVKVLFLAADRADLMINGTVLRRMQAGQTSPEGVRLISATQDAAEVEVRGKRYKLRQGETAGASLVLQADRRGHFFTTMHINGHPIQAVVDTGASSVAINSVEAQRMGINYARAPQMDVYTANGKCKGWRVMLDSVRVGEIELRNVHGAVIEGGPERLREGLIGMSFLSRLDMQRSGTTLTLSKPQ